MECLGEFVEPAGVRVAVGANYHDSERSRVVRTRVGPERGEAFARVLSARRDRAAEGGSGVSMMPASGLLETAGAFAAGGAGAGAATAAGGVTGACSLVVMLSFAGGTETPSYGLGLALVGADCATSMVLLKTNVAAATREKRVFVIACT